MPKWQINKMTLLKHHFSLELLMSCRDLLQQQLQTGWEKLHLFMFCCNHLHSLQTYSMWGTETIRLFYNISLCSQNKGSQMQLNTRRHLDHRIASFRGAVPLVHCHHDWIRHRGTAETATCRFLAQIPAANSNWIFDFKSVLWNSLWYNFIRHPACMCDNLPEAAAAILGARHKCTPHNPPPGSSLSSNTPPAAGLESGWEPPGCRLLIKADWFFSWWGEKRRCVSLII